MAGVVRSLITRILFRSDPSGLKRVETHTRAAKREMRSASRAAWKLNRDLQGLAIGFKGVVAGLVAGRIAKFVVHDFARAADETAKFADGLGVSTEAYQKLEFAAGLAGISAKELQTTLPKLAKSAGDAADGSKQLALAFKRAGIELRGKKALGDPIEMLTAFADGLKDIQDPIRRAQILQTAFGRAGKKMGVLMASGADGIKKAMAEAEKYGFVLSRRQQKIAEEYNDEILRAKMVFIGLRNQIAVKLLPAINKNLRAFSAWARESGNLKKLLRRLEIAIKAVAAAAALVVGAKLAQAIQTIAGAAKLAAHWLSIMWKAQAMVYAKAILIIAIIAAVVLVIQSLIVWSRGGKSAIGDLFEHLGIADKARGFVVAFGEAWRRLVPIFKRVGAAWLKFARFMFEAYVAIYREFEPSLRGLANALVELFWEVWPEVERSAAQIRSALIELGKAAAKAWREDLKPAIGEVMASLSDLWVAAYPILTTIWAAIKTAGAFTMTLAAKALPYLGKAAAATFSGMAALINFTVSQLTLFVKTVTFIVARLREAYNLMLAVTGLQKAGGGVAAGATAAAAKGARVASTIKAQTSVGTVSVSVTGTTAMGPDELARFVTQGVKDALQEQVNDTVTTVLPLVPA